jgi:hypothetical protein
MATLSTALSAAGDDTATIPIVHRRKSRLPSHQHIPLVANTKTIRLLQVHLKAGYESISCSLSQHSLDQKPSYIALSYTWDLGAGMRNINCDGMVLDIGQNLWNFLFEFRKKHNLRQYHSWESRSKICYLWIDAICIDQSNLEERNHQVAQMRDVYSNAESVIVWLGLAKGHEELAFLLTRHPNLLKVDEFQRELLSLLGKKYFTRVWVSCSSPVQYLFLLNVRIQVVQEFVLARSVILWCSEFFADAIHFDKLWREDEELPGLWNLQEAILKTPAWPLFKYRRDFRRRNLEEMSSYFRLRNLLMSFASSQSTEVYDKIYGFLGIALSTPGDTHTIVPDYSKQPVEVLADVLRNQCCQQSTAVDQGDYELLTFLMHKLRVSRLDFARYLLRNKPKLEEDIYILAISDLMVTSVCFLGSITKVGSYEHIHPFSYHNTKIALSRSSTHVSRLSNTDVRTLGTFVVTPEMALALELDKGGRGTSVLQAAIQKSTQSIMQSLSCQQSDPKTSPCDPSFSQSQTNQEVQGADFRRLLSRSLKSSSENYRIARRIAKEQESSYQYRKYATFTSTNGLIGVTCDESSLGKGPAFFDNICLFDGSTESTKALIIERHSPDRYTVVGSAIIAKSASRSRSGGVVQSLQRMFRTSKGDNTVTASQETLTSGINTDVKRLCFHIELSDLFELSRCGILHDAQLDLLLELSLKGESDDEVHKCKLGTGQCPSLEFGI